MRAVIASQFVYWTASYYHHFRQFGIALSIIALVLLFGFFVTSANSATYELSMLTSFGDTTPIEAGVEMEAEATAPEA